MFIKRQQTIRLFFFCKYHYHIGFAFKTDILSNGKQKGQYNENKSAN